MAGHPDPSDLAEFREGLPGRWRSARLRAHLARCSRCAAIDHDLARVTAALAAAPVPAMPDRVVTRLTDALAAEAAARSRDSAPASSTPSSSTPAGAASQAPTGAAPAASAPAGHLGSSGAADESSPQRRVRTRRRLVLLRPATLGGAIVLAALAGVGYGLAQLNYQGGGSSAGSASGPEVGSGVPASGGSSSGQQPAYNGPGDLVPTASFQLVHSGTDYQPGHLTAQVKAVLAAQKRASRPEAEPPSVTNGPEAGGPGKGSHSASPARLTQLQECVALITGGTTPSLVDGARYQGQPATIIVRSATSARTGQIWVAGPACSATSRDLLAHTTLTRTG